MDSALQIESVLAEIRADSEVAEAAAAAEGEAGAGAQLPNTVEDEP